MHWQLWSSGCSELVTFSFATLCLSHVGPSWALQWFDLHLNAEATHVVSHLGADLSRSSWSTLIATSNIASRISQNLRLRSCMHSPLRTWSYDMWSILINNIYTVQACTSVQWSFYNVLCHSTVLYILLDTIYIHSIPYIIPLFYEVYCRCKWIELVHNSMLLHSGAWWRDVLHGVACLPGELHESPRQIEPYE